MAPVPVTLLTAAAAAMVNLWLGWRISSLRAEFKVSVGDGGHEPLIRRMRAQANFVENVPVFLMLLGGLELSGADWIVLALIAIIFILARIAHGVGMDRADLRRWRMYGMMSSTFATLALTFWAIAYAAMELLRR
jgi:uncharacterized membrane protein YecN with MAPEG domain